MISRRGWKSVSTATASGFHGSRLQKRNFVLFALFRSRHFGPLCGIKNVPRIFSPPPLFFFSLFLDTRKFADRETRERVVVAKNRGVEEKLNRREGQIRLLDESFIYVVYIPVNQFNQNSLWQND